MTVTTRIAIMVFAVLLLQGSGLAQGPYDKEWCALYARIFRETVAAREQGDSLKDRLELLAQAQRMREEPHGESKEGKFHLSVIFWATINVYKNSTYQGFGPEMTALDAQMRCREIGPAEFMIELQSWGQKYLNNK